jgi:hypothetical protein
VTHPPETRTCIHCGGRVVRGRAEAELRPGPAASRGPFGPLPEAEPEDGAVEGARAARPLRIAVAVLWVLVAIGGTLWQRCQNAP